MNILNIEDLITILELKKNEYSKIIIYGYKGIAEVVLDYLMRSYYGINGTPCSEYIRCLASSSDSYEVRRGRQEIKGFPIYPISELVEYADKDLVIITTEENEHKKDLGILSEYNFKNVICITKELYTKLRMYNAKVAGEEKLEVMAYALEHQKKVEQLRRKVSVGKQVKVLFLVNDITSFSSKSVYKAMEENQLFQPYILASDENDIEYMEQLEPEILFVDDCTKPGMSKMRWDLLNWKYLTCYVPNAFLYEDKFYSHYESMCVKTVWKYFLDTKYSYKRGFSEADFNAGNIVLAGCPKYDFYFEEKNELKVLGDIDNDKKIIVFAPCQSTETKYYDYLLQLAINNPDISFVFMPYRESKDYCQDAVKLNIYINNQHEKRINEWNNLPNGMYIEAKEYEKVFSESFGLITDCEEAFFEYISSGKPCIYLMTESSKLHKCVEVICGVQNTHYFCDSLESVAQVFAKLVYSGIDEKQEKRVELLQREFYNLGCAGKYICDYIEEQLH